jgi:hypothetical protein
LLLELNCRLDELEDELVIVIISEDELNPKLEDDCVWLELDDFDDLDDEELDEDFEDFEDPELRLERDERLLGLLVELLDKELMEDQVMDDDEDELFTLSSKSANTVM